MSNKKHQKSETDKTIAKSKNFLELIFNFIKRILSWIFKSPIRIIITFLLLFLILIFTARFGGFGTPIQKIVKTFFLSYYIPDIDPPPYKVSLLVELTVWGKMGDRRLHLGESAQTGEELTIAYQADLDCNLLIINVDSKQINIVPPQSGKSEYIRAGVPYEPYIITLDDAVGLEYYYFITSDKPFSYEKDIKQHIKSVFPAGHVKGNAMKNFELNLPDNFSSKLYYFEHIK